MDELLDKDDADDADDGDDPLDGELALDRVLLDDDADDADRLELLDRLDGLDGELWLLLDEVDAATSVMVPGGLSPRSPTSNVETSSMAEP